MESSTTETRTSQPHADAMRERLKEALDHAKWIGHFLTKLTEGSVGPQEAAAYREVLQLSSALLMIEEELDRFREKEAEVIARYLENIAYEDRKGQKAAAAAAVRRPAKTRERAS